MIYLSKSTKEMSAYKLVNAIIIL